MTEELRRKHAGQIAELLQLGFVEAPPARPREIKFNRGQEEICLGHYAGWATWSCFLNDRLCHQMWRDQDYEMMMVYLRVPAKKYLDDLSEQKARIADLEATITEMLLSPYPGEDYMAAATSFAELKATMIKNKN